MERLSKAERVAKRVCEYMAEPANALSEWSFGIEFRPSRTWGTVPTIEWGGEKVASASGCGYDKESACLVDFLRFLPGLNRVPYQGSTTGETYVELCKASGAGVRSVIQLLAESGWTLTQVYTGKREDGFTIRRSTLDEIDAAIQVRAENDEINARRSERYARIEAERNAA